MSDCSAFKLAPILALVLLPILFVSSSCEMPAFVTHTKKKDGYRQLVCTELICRHKRMMEKQGIAAAPHANEVPESVTTAPIPTSQPIVEPEVVEPNPAPATKFKDAVDLAVAPVVSSTLLFKMGKAELLSDRVAYLDELADFLINNTQYRIGINGHTDNTGSDEINNRLSAQRAETVAVYLIREGVAPERVSWQGFGSSQPIASNDSQSGREKNRRVEFIVNP